MKVNLFLPLFFLLTLTACRSESADQGTESYQARCQDILKQYCHADCSAEKFKYCYVDPKYTRGRIHWRNDCYALHSGEQCAPCKSEFSVNSGGAFRQVSCEYFLEAIDRKNSLCGNCLQRIENFEYFAQDEIEFK